MNDSESARQQLLDLVQSRLIPWAGAPTLRIVSGQPPFHGIETDAIRPVSAPLLSNKAKAPPAATVWPEASMNAAAYPCICCILEGQVEWRVGVTRRMQQAQPELAPRYGRYNLHLSAKTFLVMPPDIPFNDGAHPHWSSSEEIPDSLIFWINCAPRGVDLHLCRTRNGLHESLLPAYLQDEQPLIMADLLLDDLRTSVPLATTSRHYLLIILLRLERMLVEKRGLFTSTARVLAPRAQDTAYDDDASRATPETLLVQRAQRFIQTHLTTTLTTRQLAGHLYISPSHLNRLFVRELGISPMQYFTQARMELARNLLIQSQHPIRYISNFFGYSHPDVFSRAFKQHFGVSPRKYRRQPPAASDTE